MLHRACAAVYAIRTNVFAACYFLINPPAQHDTVYFHRGPILPCATREYCSIGLFPSRAKTTFQQQPCYCSFPVVKLREKSGGGPLRHVHVAALKHVDMCIESCTFLSAFIPFAFLVSLDAAL